MSAKNFGQEIKSESEFVEELSDEELLKMKSEILKELEEI